MGSDYIIMIWAGAAALVQRTSDRDEAEAMFKAACKNYPNHTITIARPQSERQGIHK